MSLFKAGRASTSRPVLHQIFNALYRIQLDPTLFFLFFYFNRSHVNQNHDNDVHILSSDHTVYAIRSDANTIISFLGKVVVSGLWIYYIVCLTHVRIHNSKDQIKQLLVGDKNIFFSLTCVFSKKKLNT